jgi:hypothetical protein
MIALLANLPSPRIEGSLSCGTGHVADESSKWNVDLCRDSTEESNNLLKPGAVDGLFEAPIVFGLALDLSRTGIVQSQMAISL